ncbi:MAG: hypothetical protein QXG27_04430 [Candidatus Bathyarchaeia archaeon]
MLRKFLKSKRALTIPVTYLMLFVSLLALVSVTYSFAVAKISARGALLKVSVAKQNMQILDDAVRSVAFNLGASKVVFMDDCGGNFQVAPSEKNLILNFTDEQTFAYIVFNSSTGKAFYELEAAETHSDGLFVRGDERTIINRSAYMTQLYFSAGDDSKELTLCYRPSAASTFIGTSNGKPLNLIRVFVISLNASTNLLLSGKFYLKVSATSVTSIIQQYEFYSEVSSLALKANFDGISTTVWLPISSVSEGAFVNLEIIIYDVKIEPIEV